MFIGCCTQCKYLDLINDNSESRCPRCSGQIVSLNIKSDEWNKLSKADQDSRISAIIPDPEPQIKETSIEPVEVPQKGNFHLHRDGAEYIDEVDDYIESADEEHEGTSQIPSYNTEVSIPRKRIKQENSEIQISESRPTKKVNFEKTNAEPVESESDYYDRFSKMSIVAFVLSFFGCLGIVGIVLGIIDLTKKDGRKRGLSIAAIIIGLVLNIGSIAFGILAPQFIKYVNNQKGASSYIEFEYDGGLTDNEIVNENYDNKGGLEDLVKYPIYTRGYYDGFS